MPLTSTQTLAAALLPTYSDKFDAYFLIAFKTDFADYPQKLLNKANFSVTLRLKFAGAPSKRLADMAQFKSLFTPGSGNLLATAQLDGMPGQNQFFATAEVMPALLIDLVGLGYVKRIHLAETPVPNRNLPRSRAKPGVQDAAVPTTAQVKLLAIIDNGCPFAHEAYRIHHNQSRILAIWDQDDLPDFPAAVGRLPQGFGYGRQVDRTAINSFVAAGFLNGSPQINENICYQLAEYDVMSNRATHGSQLLGLLASSSYSPTLLAHKAQKAPLNDAAASADIVFVQLPRHTLLSPSKGAGERYFLDGLRYVLNCAGPQTTEIDAVLAYGSDLGAHDGSGLFEQAVESMVQEAAAKGITFNVIFPTGNSFDDKRHAQADGNNLASNSALQWAMPYDNDVPAVCEFWLDDKDIDGTVAVTPPVLGATALIVNLGANDVKTYPAVDPYFSIAVKVFANQTQVVVQASPSGMPDQNRPIAPVGLWDIVFDVSSTASAASKPMIDAYAEYVGRNEGFPKRGIETHFLSPNGSHFSVQGSGSIMGSACGTHSYAIGGYVGLPDYKRSKYSGAGPVRGGPYASPVVPKGAKFVAPTDGGYYARGVLCMGTRSAVWQRSAGTSLAAPQVARELMVTGVLTPIPYNPGPPPTWPHANGVKEFGEARLAYP